MFSVQSSRDTDAVARDIGYRHIHLHYIFRNTASVNNCILLVSFIMIVVLHLGVNNNSFHFANHNDA